MKIYKESLSGFYKELTFWSRILALCGPYLFVLYISFLLGYCLFSVFSGGPILWPLIFGLSGLVVGFSLGIFVFCVLIVCFPSGDSESE